MAQPESNEIMKSQPQVFLLINPWITDFAAFDFWSKPLGLLYLAAVLQQAGARIHLIDCMDRFDPSLRRAMPHCRKNDRRFGTGKYIREVIPKPGVLQHVPRYYARYGLPLELFREKLCRLPRPKAVLVTSGMTYWYPGVRMVIREVRAAFGAIPVLLGGIYATLMPEHALASSGADAVIEGEAENRLVAALNEMVPAAALTAQHYATLDDLPAPAWEHYDYLPYATVLTSRGCPLRCTFCASRKVSGDYRFRSVDGVVAEISWLMHKHGVHDIAFYDDALLTNRDRHFRAILAALREHGLKPRLHTPNGLQCKFIDPTLAQEMRATGFYTVRLSLETVNEARRGDMSHKVNVDSFARAAESLRSAGFGPEHLDAYVLMALPGQPLAEVLQSMAFVHTQGVGIRLAAYSPIPGTVDHARAVVAGSIAADADPLLTNNTAIPVRPADVPYAAYERVSLLAKQLNAQLRNRGRPIMRQSDLVQNLYAQFTNKELYARVNESKAKHAS